MTNRVEAILARLSLEEKAALSIGSDAWHTAPLPSHGVGRVKVTDGPTGARGDGASGATATCFPVGVAVGATWDVELVAELGAALAEEARTKDAQVLLGPTINLQRTPIGGRNFECYSEDPLLTGRLATAFVAALQGAGVGACVKHFVGNDVEYERHEASADMDEATLREVALLPFELVVRDADPWSIMAAYNRLNGETCTASRRLLTDILKDEWSWDGAVMSDWGAVKGTVATLNAGCDLEMPGPSGWLGAAKVVEAVRRGEVDEVQVDDLARRMLVLAERAGRLDEAEESPERSADEPARRALARRVATSSFVLLKNDGTLPLREGATRRLAVIGPNVEGLMIQGGGSSQVKPHGRVVGLIEALTASLGPDVEVIHEVGCTNGKWADLIPDERWEGASPDVAGLRPASGSVNFARRRDDGPVLVEMFDNVDFDGEPAWAYRADGMSTAWFGQIRRLSSERFSGRLTGRYVPEASGTHEFGLSAVGRSRLFIEGRLVVDNWDPAPGDTFFASGSEEVRAGIELHAGVPVEVVVEFAVESRQGIVGVRVGVDRPEPEDLLARAVEAARSSDAAIVVVGTTADWETEGNDRRAMELPGRQAELLTAVASANERTVAVVNAGSPVDMGWVDEVGAAMQVWFGGQEMGPALTEVLLGRADPGGRLPHTVPASLADHPAAASYPGRDGHLPYDEGVLCGHRWYDAKGIEPRFAFGHGLSYADFTWGQARVDRAALSGDEPQCTVTVPVTNDSDRDGFEVVQVYVAAPGPDRPIRELKGFQKQLVPAGATVEFRVTLGRDAFRRWSPVGWIVEPGAYAVSCGASSLDLRSTVDVEVR